VVHTDYLCVRRVAGLQAELFYVREGVINDYALNFVVPVPAHINDLHFTWQSLAGRPVSIVPLFFIKSPAFVQRASTAITRVAKSSARRSASFCTHREGMIA